MIVTPERVIMKDSLDLVRDNLVPQPANPTNISSPLTIWDANTTYNLNNVVIFDSKIYVSNINGNKGIVPYQFDLGLRDEILFNHPELQSNQLQWSLI